MSGELLYFLAMVLALTGQAADCYTSQVGLAHGQKEFNPILRFIVAHAGLTGMWLFKVLGYAFLFPAISEVVGGLWYGQAGAFVAAGWGFIAAVVNYFLLRSKKISIF